MRSIVVFSAAYVVVSAIVLLSAGSVSSVSAAIETIPFSLAFSYPMIVCCLLAIWVPDPLARKALLSLEVVFACLSAIVFFSVFAGEHDAQYQLGLLMVPVTGLLFVVIAGVIAAAMRIGIKRAKDTV